MNKNDMRIKKIMLRSDGGLHVEYLVKLSKGKGFIWSADKRDNALPKHVDLQNFEDELRHHACKVAQVNGVYGVDTNDLSKDQQKVYDQAIDAVTMNSITLSSNDEGQIYAVILSAKMKVLGGLNYNIVTPNVQLEKVDVYEGAIGLKETLEDLINEVFLWITDSKSSQTDLFNQPTEGKEEEVKEPELEEVA